jgi:dTDP-4-amino-4,6-dideoxygalactose transaminase
MDVPLLDLRLQYATIRNDVRAAVDRVLDSQRFILGAEGEAFERELAGYCGAPHGVGLASGAAAQQVLALPVHPELTPERRGWVVESVAEFYGGRK